MKLFRMLRSRFSSPTSTRVYRFVAEGFDRSFYLARYPDVRVAGVDPVLHYLEHGHRENRDPSPDFSTAGYLARNPDVVHSGINPFFHYLEYGRYENRDARPLSTGSVVEPVDWRSEFDDAAIEEDSAQIPVLQDVFPALATLDGTARSTIDPAHVALRKTSPRMTGILAPACPLPRAHKPEAASEASNREDDATARILAAAEDKDLTFDVWNTALQRLSASDAVKLRNARAIWLTQFPPNSGESALHPVDLFQLRRCAEVVCADLSGNYRIEDVSARLSDWLGLDETFADEFTAREIAIEQNAATPDPIVAQVLAKHPGRHIAVVNCALPAAAVQNILSTAGIERIDGVHSSHVSYPNRDHATIFDRALAMEKLEYGKAIHLSARYETGVEAARSCGLDAIYYYSASEFSRREACADAMARHVQGDSAAVLHSLLERAEYRYDRPIQIEAMAIPATAFVMHVLEETLRRQLDRVYFLTREGVFFKRIYDILIRADVFDLGAYPEAVVLEASRKSTFAASLNSFSREPLMRLWSQYSDRSLTTLFTTLNLDLEHMALLARSAGLDMDTPRTTPWHDGTLTAFLARVDVQDAVLPSLKAQRDGLLAYLDTIGFEPEKDCERLLVDIGWRGTIQDNIAHLVKGRIHGCYFGLENFLNEQTTNVTKDGFIKDVPAGIGLRLADVAALEFLFNTPGGSVTGYKNGRAQREILDGEEEIAKGPVAGFQNRIVSCAQRLTHEIRQHGLVSQDLRGLAREVLSVYFAEPPKDVACAYLALEHNESFGVAGVTTMGFDSKRIEALRGLNGPALHAEILHGASHVRWPAAKLQLPQFLDHALQLDQSRSLNLPVFSTGHLALDPRFHEIAVFAPSADHGRKTLETLCNVAEALAWSGYGIHFLFDGTPNVATKAWLDAKLQSPRVIQHTSWPSALAPAIVIAATSDGARAAQDMWGPSTPILNIVLSGDTGNIAGSHFLCQSRWNARRIQEELGAVTAIGGLGLDPAFFGQLQDDKRPRKIVVHADGRDNGRSVRLKLAALELVKAKHPDVTVVVLNDSGSARIAFEHEPGRIADDPDALADLYRQSIIGLFDSENGPQREIFEAMACGCVPVDTYRRANLFDHSDDTVVLAMPAPRSLALAIGRLLDTGPDLLAARARSCVAASRRTAKWESDLIINAMALVLRGDPFVGSEDVVASYRQPAVVDPSDNSAETRRYLERQSQAAGI